MRLDYRRAIVAAAVVVLLAMWLELPGSLRRAQAHEAALTDWGPCAPQATCPNLRPASVQPLLFDNGAPDGRMAMASRPDIGIGQIEIEAADDFVLTSTVRISSARFTGLMPGMASLGTIQQVDVEIYRVFPLDSDTVRTISVPTRANSPADVSFDARSTSGGLTFNAAIVAQNFGAANSVLNGINKSPNQLTGGEGPVSGEEVQFDVTMSPTVELAAGHYFFVPQVALSSGNFYWLSASGPTLAGDLQAWIRNANLQPDWLRVGSDIVGGTVKFNGSFALWGTRVYKTFLPLIRR